ncbi:MAG: nucleotidyltransferase domain-containing protein [Prevotellaceae bacterium]|jgi:predicted nucleotidyltransferase|nr:nucleotidyltransferase domain-containing protein [Prevotellaceae bacterium]
MRQNIQQTLANYFMGQPIEKAWLFGSYSRGEATRHSDIDILVSFIPDSQVTLLKYAHIVNDLQKLLRKKVDLVENGTLRDFAVNSVQHDKILIYERTAKRQ